MKNLEIEIEGLSDDDGWYPDVATALRAFEGGAVREFEMWEDDVTSVDLLARGRMVDLVGGR